MENKEAQMLKSPEPTSTDVKLSFYMTIIFLNIKPPDTKQPYVCIFCIYVSAELKLSH